MTSRPPSPAGFDHSHYVPILLTRQGERLALEGLPQEVKDRLTPLFVVHPVPNDLETGSPKGSVEEHLGKLAKELVKKWGSGSGFVDLAYVDTEVAMSDGSHPLVWMVRTCEAQGLLLAPVLDGGRSPSYVAAAAEAAREVGSSLCFRLPIKQWVSLGTPLGDGQILGLLQTTGFQPQQVHVILDVADQVSSPPDLTASAVSSAISRLPRLTDWLSMTVCGTGMPVGTAEVGANRSQELPRLEWQLWRQLMGSSQRRPTFGDYCVQHPDPLSAFDPRFMQSSAQLRYTIRNSWFVARGRGIRSAGSAQIRGLARQVVNHTEFAGAAFSAGDQWIASCADGTSSPGNQLVWRKATTNHHLTFVVNQIASLLGT